MIALFHCAACGFLSTRGREFKIRSGVRFDIDCLERADRGEQPIGQWVAEKIEDHAGAITPPNPLSLPLAKGDA